MLKLKTKSEFSRVYNQGKKIFGYFLLIYYKKNSTTENRFGVVASKKTGNAVCRNRLKRLFREIYRKQNSKLKKGYDIVFIAKKIAGENYKTINLTQIQKDSIKIFKRADLYI